VFPAGEAILKNIIIVPGPYLRGISAPEGPRFKILINYNLPPAGVH